MYDVISVRRANPIAEVIGNAGVELRRLGQRLKGQCPFHADTQPSLVVYPQDGNYYCFGCGIGGDVIDFVARLHGVRFLEAVRLLGGGGAVPKPIAGVVDAAHRFSVDPPTEAEAMVISAAATFYHESLRSSPPALAYLALRGIDRETARKCRIGYGAPGLAAYLRRRAFRLDDAWTVGLIHGSRETMLSRIVVPDVCDGQAKWLTGRTLCEATPRYMNLRLATPLLGFGRVSGDEVIVTEGVFDWLTLSQWAVPSVALLGTRISKRTVDVLRRFRRVYITLDSDDPGRRASAELASALGKRAAVVELPTGIHDLNDLGRSPDGRQAFQRCLELLTNGRKIEWETTDEPTAQQAA